MASDTERGGEREREWEGFVEGVLNGESFDEQSPRLEHLPSDYEDVVAADSIVVTTADLRRSYDVVGPIYFQTSNRGLFSSAFSRLRGKWENQLASIQRQTELREEGGALSELMLTMAGEWSVGNRDFDAAFFIAVEELKRRAACLEAHAIVGLRLDIDIDTNGFAYFYLQMYGTAVRFRRESESV